MIRRVSLVLFFLIVSVYLGLALAHHPGQVLLNYGEWVVEMPLWLFALILITTFFVLHGLLRFMTFMQQLDQRFVAWLAERRRHKAVDKTERGLLGLMEQQWSVAERHLLAGIHKAKNPVVNYLAAAEAAHAQKAFDRSELYLKKAYEAAPHNEVVIGLVQARLQMEQGQMEQALAILNRLRQRAGQHAGVLKLLQKMHIRLRDWKSLLELLPALRKAKVIKADQVLLFEKNIYCEMLNEAHSKNWSIHEVRELWVQMPKRVRLQEDMLERYAQLVSTDKASAEELEPLIRKVLQREWHENLAKIYGSLLTSEPMHQLSVAEAWTKPYGKQAPLLLTLGRLCLRCQLWGKARQYLEEGLKQGPSSETQLELARLLEHLGETQLALRHYKDGLELAAAT